MTRKKYSADTYYAALEAALYSNSSDEEEQESKLSDEEIYDIICYYYDEAFWNIDWVQKWLDPVEIEKIIYSDMEYVTYTLQFYEQETCERMRDIIHHMCTTLLLKPTPLMVENILGAMFNVRNRYDMNIPHTSTHWTRKWGQTLNKSYNMCMRQ